MRHTIPLTFALLLLTLSASAEFLPGFKQFRYFMSPPEVKELLASNGFAASDLRESYDELCLNPYITQDLLAYDSITRQFFSCSFTSNIPELVRRTEGRVLHLTIRNARDFMQLSVPASRASNEFKDWDQLYIFYNNPNLVAQDPRSNWYQLIAVVLRHRGVTTMGDWRILRTGYLARLDKELRVQFGFPDAIEESRYDRLSRVTRQHFNHVFQGTGKDGPYRLQVQVNASWATFGSREANLQLTFMTAEFSPRFLHALTPGDYEVGETEGASILSGKAPAPR